MHGTQQFVATATKNAICFNSAYKITNSMYSALGPCIDNVTLVKIVTNINTNTANANTNTTSTSTSTSTNIPLNNTNSSTFNSTTINNTSTLNTSASSQNQNSSQTSACCYPNSNMTMLTVTNASLPTNHIYIILNCTTEIDDNWDLTYYCTYDNILAR